MDQQTLIFENIETPGGKVKIPEDYGIRNSGFKRRVLCQVAL